MIAHYKPNEQDRPILNEITDSIRGSLGEWYGPRARLETAIPAISSYKNSFILRYSVSIPDDRQKHILVKIRRNPKMDSLVQAIQADIHQNMEQEYLSLRNFYDHLTGMQEELGAIRPLDYLDQFPAIVMEEYPSRTLRRLLIDFRSSKAAWAGSDLQDAARKTGRGLYYFHHHLNTSFEADYTTGDILNVVGEYAEQIESYSRGRVKAGSILDPFSKQLENIHIEQVTISRTHSDMTIDNVLYSNERKVCLIDLKNQPAPVYVDLGLILIHPETSKSQIFSAGNYFPETLLQAYRNEIVAGYFEAEPGNAVLVRIYGAIMVVDKWLMYEKLMGNYKRAKRALSILVAPLVSSYFNRLLRKHLTLIETAGDGQALKLPLVS
jgi:thiamine kinase-like enzyme